VGGPDLLVTREDSRTLNHEKRRPNWAGDKGIAAQQEIWNRLETPSHVVCRKVTQAGGGLIRANRPVSNRMASKTFFSQLLGASLRAETQREVGSGSENPFRSHSLTRSFGSLHVEKASCLRWHRSQRALQRVITASRRFALSDSAERAAVQGFWLLRSRQAGNRDNTVDLLSFCLYSIAWL
jgi:hypothetical protein